MALRLDAELEQNIQHVKRRGLELYGGMQEAHRPREEGVRAVDGRKMGT